jgi:hypothetical protein
MLTVNYNNTLFELPSTFDELTVEQFEEITSIINQNTEETEKWSSILIYLGLPESALNHIQADDFIDIIKEYTTSFDTEAQLIEQIEVDGHIYEWTGGLTIKDLQLIEAAVRRGRFLLRSMAILYKRSDLSFKEHYEHAHIDHKMKLFKENQIKARLALWPLNIITEKVVKKIENATS